MIDDKACREVLRNKIELIKKEHPKKYAKELSLIMAEMFNVKHAMTVGIFNDLASFETMSYDTMYKLMVSLNELSKRYINEFDVSDLNPKKYFTENETILYEKKYEYAEEDFDIIITDWHRQRIGLYDLITIYIDNKTELKWRDYNKLRFNPETQRDLIVIKTQGVPIMKLDINKKSINEIKKLMIKGMYYPVSGIININLDYVEDDPIYFSNGNLIIPKESKMDLIEGFHNYIARTQTSDENPEWEFPVEYKLLFLNVEEANRFILQMDKKNHFRESQKIKMEIETNENYVVNRINTSNKFHLHGTIDKTYFTYLYKLLLKIFNLEDRKQSIELTSVIVDNINYLIEKNNHYEIPLNKKEWFVVLYLTKKCIDNNVEFEVIFDKIGFNSLIGEIDIINSPLRKHYKIIDKAFEEVIK